MRSGPVVRPKVDGRGIHATATLLNSPKNSSAERDQLVVAHAGSKSTSTTSTTIDPLPALASVAGTARGRVVATACSRSRTAHLSGMQDDGVNSTAPVVGLLRHWPPRVIGFDGDDTLWHSESLFSMTQGRFRMPLMHHVDLPSTLIDARLAETVQRNLSVYGHGIKGFVLSMVETAITVTDGRIPAQDIHTILSFGRTMLEYPVELAEGAREVLETLRARDHELWLIADGDVFDQESKLARSGLASLFHHIAIVTEKSEDTYRRLLDQHGVLPEEFAMVGNALRSDVLPSIEIGACAYHVPDPVTSGSRKAEVGPGHKGAYRAIPNFGALLQVLDTPEDETA